MPKKIIHWETPGDLKLEIDNYFEKCIKREWVLTYDENGVEYKKQKITRIRPFLMRDLVHALGVRRGDLYNTLHRDVGFAPVIDDARNKGTYKGIRIKWTRTKWPPGTKCRKITGTEKQIKYKTSTEFREHVDEYFEHCLERSRKLSIGKDGEEYYRDVVQQIKPFTMTGLSVWLEVSKNLLKPLGERGADFRAVIDYARKRCENFAEEHLFSGKNATGAIFSLKNCYGWHDTHKQEISGADGGPVGINVNDDKAKQARDALLLMATGGPPHEPHS